MRDEWSWTGSFAGYLQVGVPLVVGGSDSLHVPLLLQTGAGDLVLYRVRSDLGRTTNLGCSMEAGV